MSRFADAHNQARLEQVEAARGRPLNSPGWGLLQCVKTGEQRLRDGNAKQQSGLYLVGKRGLLDHLPWRRPNGLGLASGSLQMRIAPDSWRAHAHSPAPDSRS